MRPVDPEEGGSSDPATAGWATLDVEDWGVDAIPMVPIDTAPVELHARCVEGDRVSELSSTGTGSPRLRRAVANAVALFVVMLGAGLALLATLPMVIGYRPIAVLSGSMEPSIRVADVVVSRSPSTPDIGVGAVIDFRRDDQSVLHRVVEVTTDGYRTRGDANQSADSELVASEDISGVGVYVVPLVGLPSIWWSERAWPQLLAVGAVFATAVHVSRAAWLLRQPSARRWARGRA